MNMHNINLSSLKEQINQSWLAYEISNYDFWGSDFQRYDFQIYISDSDVTLSNKVIQVTVQKLLQFRQSINSVVSESKHMSIMARKPTGRILVYSPDATMYDCLAQCETEFFNEADIPTWQSWLRYVCVEPENYSGYLLSWIPDGLLNDYNFFITIIQNGFFWSDDLDYIRRYGDDELLELCLNVNTIVYDVQSDV